MKNACLLMAVLALAVATMGFLAPGAHADEYRVRVYTGDIDWAGTDANVYVWLEGADRSSSRLQLDNGDDNFERDGVDTFYFSLRSLGDLEGLWIAHDNSGFLPDWYLDKVVVRNLTTDEQRVFPYYGWMPSHSETVYLPSN